VYIDLGFYRELARRFGAPGDFAQAYVIAHEVGHHVQNLLGVSERVQRLAQRDPSQRNALSVRVELQADCYAGVWGHSAAQRKLLEPGDAEEGLRAAAASRPRPSPMGRLPTGPAGSGEDSIVARPTSAIPSRNAEARLLLRGRRGIYLGR
jgi:hypothetical protein